MPHQFRVIKGGQLTTGDRGDWGVVYTPLGVFLNNEVEEIPDPAPELDSTGSTTPDGGEAPPDSTGSTTADGGEDPEPKKRTRK